MKTVFQCEHCHQERSGIVLDSRYVANKYYIRIIKCSKCLHLTLEDKDLIENKKTRRDGDTHRTLADTKGCYTRWMEHHAH